MEHMEPAQIDESMTHDEEDIEREYGSFESWEPEPSGIDQATFTQVLKGTYYEFPAMVNYAEPRLKRALKHFSEQDSAPPIAHLTAILGRAVAQPLKSYGNNILFALNDSFYEWVWLGGMRLWRHEFEQMALNTLWEHFHDLLSQFSHPNT